MNMNPLPPQAYTKETLTQAFSWLQSQPESIKEMVSTPDILVSLYLKTKMQGEGVLERPSIQNFKNDLKSLAGMMVEFDSPNKGGASQTSSMSSSSGVSSSRVQDSLKQSIEEMHAAAPAPKAKSTFKMPAPTSYTQTTPAAAQPAAADASFEFRNLDSRTLGAIQDVKNSCNLSSDLEALRMLVSLGYQQVQKILK